MSDPRSVGIGSAPPETVLPPAPDGAASEIEHALAQPPERRREALGVVAADHPKLIDAWAALGDASDELIQRYAFYRIGYHRGLDALRANGWRGSGYVRWEHVENRGFLRALDGLRAMAAEIGEDDEAERCALFLRQLDPSWPPPERR